MWTTMFQIFQSGSNYSNNILPLKQQSTTEQNLIEEEVKPSAKIFYNCKY
jgi:hypothetical protein